MKQTVEKAANDYLNRILESTDFEINFEEDNYDSGARDAILDVTERAFVFGAEWQAEQSPWISIDEQYPEDKQPVLCSSPIYGKVVLCWDELSQSWSYPESGEFYCDWDKVVCWMSIPEL